MCEDRGCVLLDSINYLLPEHAGRVVVAGSHGGMYCAYKCITGGVRGVVFNDAGIGRDEAGVASLAACDEHRLPVATIACRSARIGNAGEMLAQGVVSRRNTAAQALGVEPGMSCSEAAAMLRAGKPQFIPADPVDEYRHEVSLGNGIDEPVICIDSASLIRPQDAGRVVITGSHGGLIGGNPEKAVNVPARFLAFNDAGFGRDDAGAGRLAPLDGKAIPAVVVGCMSARIGEGVSTLEDGILSRVNAAAERLGFKEGRRLKTALIEYMAEHGAK